jgi:hypothetical protein
MTSLPLFAVNLGGWELIVIAVFLPCLAFWIWMIVDCATYETATGTKIGWLLIILLAGIVGAPLYFFIRKLPRKSQTQQPGQK